MVKRNRPKPKLNPPARAMPEQVEAVIIEVLNRLTSVFPDDFRATLIIRCTTDPSKDYVLTQDNPDAVVVAAQQFAGRARSGDTRIAF